MPSIDIALARLSHGEGLPLPSYATEHAAGLDVVAAVPDETPVTIPPGGRAAIQYISIREPLFDAYAASADFIQTYIFPGGMLISEPRFRAIAERVGLEWRNRSGFGLHYAETLRRWRARYDAAVAEARLPQGFDAPFHNLWRYYLMYCEGGFRGGGIDVAQVTLVRPG